MESKSVVLEFSKEAEDYMNIGDMCRLRFRLIMTDRKELRGHNIVIRGVEDLVVGDKLKVHVKYERYAIGEEFYMNANDHYFKDKAPFEHRGSYEWRFTFDTSGPEFDSFRRDFNPNS